MALGNLSVYRPPEPKAIAAANKNNECFATDDPWYLYWQKNNSIQFQRVFLEGGDNLQTDKGEPGKISLVPRIILSHIVAYTVQCEPKMANPALHGVILCPLGKDAINLKQVLPPWSSAMEDKYAVVLQPFVDEMCENDRTTLQRLEGYYPVMTMAGLKIDRMRILLLQNAVESGACLALVVFKQIFGPGLDQDGGGSGPPKRP